MSLTSIEVHLKAYDLLEAALQAGSVEAAIEPLRLDLEVLEREDLVRVATALAVETGLRLASPAERPRLLRRVQQARVAAMWAGS